MPHPAPSAKPIHSPEQLTPLWAILSVTVIGSFCTGVFWNAMSFIAKETYHFSQERNLVLYACMGVCYAAAAFYAGRMVRRFERRFSARTLMRLLIAIQSLLCLGPMIFEGEFPLWIAFAGVSICSAFMWPIVESYLTAGRHGKDMRRAIGLFNLVWMPIVAVPLLVMPLVIEEHGQWLLGGQSIVYLLALAPLMWFTRNPGHHAEDESAEHVPPEYRLLLRSARVLLPLSYILNAALTPILPYRLAAIDVPVAWGPPISAIWLGVRVISTYIMLKAGFWHGRWGTLLLAGVTMTGGFGLVILAPNLALMILGFAMYGVGMGIAYYTALYYALAVGNADVDAGGTHEALIGVGYTLGPLAALGGSIMGGVTGIVYVVWGMVSVGAVGAVRPYMSARALRKQRDRSEM